MNNPRIFIVDDSPMQLIFLEKMLQNEGFTIQAFSKGSELIESLKVIRPHLIISDIDMPNLNGFQLMEEINSRFNINIPFFFLSSMSDTKTKHKAKEVGAGALIHKPFEQQLLINVIDDMLNSSYQHRPAN